MSILAFCILGALLAGYALFDGYDLGMAALLPFIAHDHHERQVARDAIAPFWNGNETFLVAAGAALFAFFPLVYASAFSGFYLPFIVVLWLLIGRGISFEIREMIEHPLWFAFWDAAFSLSSLLLIVLFGVTLGNIVRGVPLAHGGYFLGLFGFLFNAYALAVALLAVLTLTLHGAVYVAMRTRGPVAARSRATALRLLPFAFAWWIVVGIATSFVRSPATFGSPPAIAVGAIVALVSLGALWTMLRRGDARRAFTASSLAIIGMLLSAAGTIFPYLLPGFPDPASGLDIYRTAPNPVALATTCVVTLVGLALLLGYRVYVARILTRPSA